MFITTLTQRSNATAICIYSQGTKRIIFMLKFYLFYLKVLADISSFILLTILLARLLP